MRFPDGREIILVGHNHGDRDVPLRLSALVKSDSGKLSNQGFTAEVSAILKDNARALESVQEDVYFLRELLGKNTDIKFVATEATQNVAEKNLEYFKQLRERFSSQLYQRNLPGAGKNHDALLLATGPVNHLKIHEPGLFRGRYLLGVESEPASLKHDEALKNFDAARDRLKAQAAGDSEFLQKISETYGELMAIYAIYDPKAHDTLLLDAVRRNTPQKYMPAAEKWMRTALAEMNAMKARDHAMATTMTERNDSGVLFVGLWHLDSLASMVQKRCIDTWGGVAPATSSVSQKAVH